MYCGHARLCVCLSTAACLHYCTDPDVTWRCGRGCLCTIGRIRNRCTGCVARPIATLWKCVAEPSGNPPGPPHAARRRHYACRRRLTPLAGVPFRPYCGGVITRTRNVNEYMLVLLSRSYSPSKAKKWLTWQRPLGAGYRQYLHSVDRQLKPPP